MFATTCDFTVTIPALPWVDLEGTVEVIVHSFGSPATRHDPADPIEFDLGAVTPERGEPLDESDPGQKWLADQIRAQIDSDKVADAINEDRAAEREDAAERRWEAARDDRLMGGLL